MKYEKIIHSNFKIDIIQPQEPNGFTRLYFTINNKC